MTLENQTLVDHLNLAQRLFAAMQESRYVQRVMNAEGAAFVGNPAKAKECITEMFEYGNDLRPLIRLICLDSLLKGGTADFAKDIPLLMFNYGFAMVPFLIRLQELGLFVQSGFKWMNFVRPFQLSVPDFQGNAQVAPDEAAAPYLGYAPLTVRIVQKLLAGEFGVVQKALQDIKQVCAETGSPEVRADVNYGVCFVGGCTYSEVNSIRRIGMTRGMKLQVLTINLFSTNEFFDNLAYEIPNYSPVINV
jgi:hypothetical protein